jgi:hypothetical protein
MFRRALTTTATLLALSFGATLPAKADLVIQGRAPAVLAALLLDPVDLDPADLEVRATWVPPQGCRSIWPAPSPIRTSRTLPCPIGGLTDMVLTRPGLASSSVVGDPAVGDLQVAGDQAFSASSRRRHRRAGRACRSPAGPRSAPIWPPVTGSGITTDSRCSAVCTRMWRWRRSQSRSGGPGRRPAASPPARPAPGRRRRPRP